MHNYLRFFGGIVPFFALIQFVSCSPSNPILPNQRITATVSAHVNGPYFGGNYYSGAFIPATDYAFWVEDENHQYVKTIRVSNLAVNVGVLGIHSFHLPTWQKATGVPSSLNVANDSLAYILPQFDGLTSASLKLSSQKDTTVSVNYDFTDSIGRPIPDGTYYLYMEVSNIIKNGIEPAIVPVVINNEVSFIKIQTRRCEVAAGVTTANILSFDIKISAFNSDTKTSTDAISSATQK